jgi:hypothetical protein
MARVRKHLELKILRAENVLQRTGIKLSIKFPVYGSEIIFPCPEMDTKF